MVSRCREIPRRITDGNRGTTLRVSDNASAGTLIQIHVLRPQNMVLSADVIMGGSSCSAGGAGGAAQCGRRLWRVRSRGGLVLEVCLVI